MRDQGLDSEDLERALERCTLHEGRTEAAAARWRLAAGGRPAGAAHRTAYAADWHRLEGLEAVTGWEEPGISGLLERVRHDGGVDSFPHATTPFRLEVTAVRDLELRGDELVIGPKGTLLRPSGLACPFGKLSKAACPLADGGARWNRLADPAHRRQRRAGRVAGRERFPVDTQLLSLDDPPAHPGGVGLAPGLARRAALADPRPNSRPWMFEALRLAGIPEGRCLLQPRANGPFACATPGWSRPSNTPAPRSCARPANSSGAARR